MTGALIRSCAVAALAAGAVACAEPTTPPPDAASQLTGTWHWETPGDPHATDGGDASTWLLTVNGSTVSGRCLEYAFLADDTLTVSGTVNGRTLSLDCSGSMRGRGPVVLHVDAVLPLDGVLIANMALNEGSSERRVYAKQD